MDKLQKEINDMSVKHTKRYVELMGILGYPKDKKLTNHLGIVKTTEEWVLAIMDMEDFLQELVSLDGHQLRPINE